MAMIRAFVFAVLVSAIILGRLQAQPPDSLVRARGDSVLIRMVDIDLRAALQALSRYVDRPVLFGGLPGNRVSLETPAPVARAQVLPLLRGLLESQQLDLAFDSTAGIYRVNTRTPPAGGARPPVSNGALAASGGLELFVIRLRHARAADVAAGVNALYGRAGAMGELGADSRARAGTLDQGLRQNVVPPQQGVPSQPPAAGGATRSAALTGEVTIVPDERTNALLVRASRSDYDLVSAAVTQLDVRPLQVLIEVLIAEIRRDRSLVVGLDAQVPQTPLPGRGGGTLGGEVSGGGAGDVIVRLLDLTIGTAQLDATLRAAAARGDVHIVSRPVLIAANNELAEILVGSQRPFIQVQRSLPTDAPSRDQVIQYRDVGTRLSVRPTISADGYVMIAVTQEVNAATTETAFDAPVISARSVQTHLLIRDRQTVVLGGLIDRQRDDTRAGIPLLSNIPLIGGLFGRMSRRTTETELFIFLTPRIIRDDDEADAVTLPFRERTGVKDPP